MILLHAWAGLAGRRDLLDRHAVVAELYASAARLLQIVDLDRLAIGRQSNVLAGGMRRHAHAAAAVAPVAGAQS